MVTFHPLLTSKENHKNEEAEKEHIAINDIRHY